MSATDELRRMLDERGVKWKDFFDESMRHTVWNGAECLFTEFPDGWTGLIMSKRSTPAQAIEITLGDDREAKLQAALNKVTDNWAKLQEKVRDLELMLLVDDATVEDYTERADLLAALRREKDRADEFHAEWKNLCEHCALLEGENAKWQAYCEELEKKLEVATLGRGTCYQILIDRDDGLIPPFTAYCSTCGVEWGFTPKYCPECGARVVGTWDERRVVVK